MGRTTKYLPVDLCILYLPVDCKLCYNIDILRGIAFHDVLSKGGISVPEKTKAQKKAQKTYMEKFVRVEIRMTPEQRAIVQAHAEDHGESVNGFIGRAISEAMVRDGADRPQEAAGQPAGAGVVSSVPFETLEVAQRAAEVTGEAVGEFLARAVDTQAQRDKSSLELGINPATGGKLEKEA